MVSTKHGVKMTPYDLAGDKVPGRGLLDKSATIANPGFNRWLVPPAALAIHLCIGMSYGLSVFWLPLSKAIPGAAPAECKDMGVWGALTTTTCNWRVSDLLYTFTI